ncbi:MAG TPA: hypothetical protein ENK57_03740 [Polyangiaceae bacterium]|nr:hypothetical protein [Polyangiaceae bacterium]
MGAEVTVEDVGETTLGAREREPVPGRLPMLAGMSLAVSAVPIPILPWRALAHLRGAVVHDVTTRHGLSLSSDAREVLAAPSSSDAMRAMFRRGVELMVRRILRRLGPLAPLSALARTFEVYALGHLLERYCAQVRPHGTVRILEPEARRVREAIDEAVLATFHPATRPTTLHVRQSAEDLRDEFTRVIDGALLGVASLPSYLQRRLDGAFDEIVERSAELRGDA